MIPWGSLGDTMGRKEEKLSRSEDTQQCLTWVGKRDDDDLQSKDNQNDFTGKPGRHYL